MKKQLIGTTALVSAGLLAGAAVNQDAMAADPMELSIGGYFQVSMEVRNEDDDKGQPGANLQEFAIYDDGEIQFTATTTLDNGIGVKARIEYEGFNQGLGSSVADEHWLEFSGAFGKLRIGSDDDVAYSMQYQAPVGAYQIGVNTTTFAVPAVGNNSVGSYPTTYIATNSDAEHIIYFSPRIAGFQLGLSYAPDDSANDRSSETGGFPGVPKLDNEVGQEEDTFSIGLNYNGEFSGVDIAVAGGYNTSSMEADTSTSAIVAFGITNITAGGAPVGTVTGVGTTTFETDDREQFSAGLSVGFAGFTIGASVALDNHGAKDRDSTTWDAGVTYSNGPLTVGLTYLYSQIEVGNQLGDDELDSFVLSGTYNLGPGVDIWGGLKYYDYQSDANDNTGAISFDTDEGFSAPGSSQDSRENEGFIAAIGSSVSF